MKGGAAVAGSRRVEIVMMLRSQAVCQMIACRISLKFAWHFGCLDGDGDE